MGRFKKGQSGNPSGRKPGSRNRSTLLFEDLLEGRAEQLIEKAVELALQGNATVLKMCLERLYPARKGRAVPVAFGELRTAEDLANAHVEVLVAMGRGEISPEEAEAAARALDAAGSALERLDLERRIVALEIGANNPPR